MSFKTHAWFWGEQNTPLDSIKWHCPVRTKDEAYYDIQYDVVAYGPGHKKYYIGYKTNNNKSGPIKCLEEVKICGCCEKIIKYGEPYEKINNMYFHKEECESDK